MTCDRCGKELKGDELKNRIELADHRDGYGEQYDLCQSCSDEFWKAIDAFMQEEG